jgi:hypothetical protein
MLRGRGPLQFRDCTCVSRETVASDRAFEGSGALYLVRKVLSCALLQLLNLTSGCALRHQLPVVW